MNCSLLKRSKIKNRLDFQHVIFCFNCRNVFELLEKINQDSIANSHRTKSRITFTNFQNSKYRGFQRTLDNDSGFLNLFHRLAEKLEKAEKSDNDEIGNYTCVLRNLHILDHNNNLDLQDLIDSFYMEPTNIPDVWLRDQQVQNYKTCYQIAESNPQHQQENVEEGKPNIAKISQFLKCLGKASCKTCMHHDICLLYTSPSPRDLSTSRMPSSA